MYECVRVCLCVGGSLFMNLCVCVCVCLCVGLYECVCVCSKINVFMRIV